MLFSAIPGHSDLKARMITSAREGRIAHAQLFLGPRGSGNLALALAYARYLVCKEPGLADACGTCPSCSMMDKLAHPDVHYCFPIFTSEKEKIRTSDDVIADWRAAVLREPLLDETMWYATIEKDNAKGIIRVSETHNSLRKLSFKSSQGGLRVLLIWYAERMNIEAANALLKGLEEPEPGTVYLLVCEHQDHLLPTIISRTQLVKVPAFTVADVAQVLGSQHQLPQAEADSIAARCEGDLLEAKAMVERTEDELFIFFRDWLRACYGRKVVETAQFSEYFASMGREQQKALMRYALYIIRQCVYHWQQAHELIRVSGQEHEFVGKFGAMLNDHNAEGIRKELELAHSHLDRNANPKILFMDLSYKLFGLLKAA